MENKYAIWARRAMLSMVIIGAEASFAASGSFFLTDRTRGSDVPVYDAPEAFIETLNNALYTEGQLVLPDEETLWDLAEELGFQNPTLILPEVAEEGHYNAAAWVSDSEEKIIWAINPTESTQTIVLDEETQYTLQAGQIALSVLGYQEPFVITAFGGEITTQGTTEIRYPVSYAVEPVLLSQRYYAFTNDYLILNDESIEISNVASVVGTELNDTFDFMGFTYTENPTIAIDGAEGSDHFLSPANIDSIIAIEFDTSSKNFLLTNIENIEGRGDADMVVFLGSEAKTWNVTQSNGGTVSQNDTVISFSGAESLAGGQGPDTFEFTVEGGLSGALIGGAGQNQATFTSSGDSLALESGTVYVANSSSELNSFLVLEGGNLELDVINTVQTQNDNGEIVLEEEVTSITIPENLVNSTLISVVENNSITVAEPVVIDGGVFTPDEETPVQGSGGEGNTSTQASTSNGGGGSFGRAMLLGLFVLLFVRRIFN